jgi:hypothetical protein
MAIPYDAIFEVVRNGGDPRSSFAALRQIGRMQMPAALWDRIRAPDVEADIWNAAAWIKGPFDDGRPTGVYFGLNTLNERDGEGFNVSMGLSQGIDPAVLDMSSWRFGGRGESYLIDGMYNVHNAWRRFDIGYPDSLIFHYLFFLGYGGVILAAALERLVIQSDCLFA